MLQECQNTNAKIYINKHPNAVPISTTTCLSIECITMGDDFLTIFPDFEHLKVPFACSLLLVLDSWRPSCDSRTQASGSSLSSWQKRRNDGYCKRKFAKKRCTLRPSFNSSFAASCPLSNSVCRMSPNNCVLLQFRIGFRLLVLRLDVHVVVVVSQQHVLELIT